MFAADVFAASGSAHRGVQWSYPKDATAARVLCLTHHITGDTTMSDTENGKLAYSLMNLPQECEIPFSQCKSLGQGRQRLAL